MSKNTVFSFKSPRECWIFLDWHIVHMTKKTHSNVKQTGLDSMTCGSTTPSLSIVHYQVNSAVRGVCKHPGGSVLGSNKWWLEKTDYWLKLPCELIKHMSHSVFPPKPICESFRPKSCVSFIIKHSYYNFWQMQHHTTVFHLTDLADLWDQYLSV